jgi:small subunit ribosomal protein S5
MRFRATVVVGDKKGRVGFGVAKGADVAMALDKASRQAKKRLVQVPLHKGTIPHEVAAKFGAAMVIIKPAPQGTGLKSGGPARIVLELAGVPNAVSKILGGKNKINNVKAAFAALKMLRKEKASTPSA